MLRTGRPASLRLMTTEESRGTGQRDTPSLPLLGVPSRTRGTARTAVQSADTAGLQRHGYERRGAVKTHHARLVTDPSALPQAQALPRRPQPSIAPSPRSGKCGASRRALARDMGWVSAPEEEKHLAKVEVTLLRETQPRREGGGRNRKEAVRGSAECRMD
jgi:hypothetical protein